MLGDISWAVLVFPRRINVSALHVDGDEEEFSMVYCAVACREKLIRDFPNMPLQMVSYRDPRTEDQFFISEGPVGVEQAHGYRLL